MGRLREKKKNEHHGEADEENEELHRHFCHGVEQQAEPALRNRTAGEISLDLRLITAEIAQREERPVYQAAPEVVAIVPVKLQIDGVQLPHGTGQIQHSVGKVDSVRHE